MKNKIVLFLIIMFGGILILIKTQKNKYTEIQELQIGNVLINYETAKTNDEIARGLSYRESIPENYGMLFVFPGIGFRTFWMHEMRVPLDIVWIADGKIVQIDKNVPIKTNGAWTVVNGNYPVNYVLEIRGGETERLGIKLGEKIEP